MNYKHVFVLVLAILFANMVSAQNFRQMEFKEYQKLWETGPVTAADFRGQATEGTGNRSELSYQIGYFPEKIKRPDTTIFRLQAYSFMDRNKSWLNPDENTAQALAYNQAIFNLVEIYERQLQSELNRVKDLDEAGVVTDQAFTRLKNEVAGFSNQTGYGQDETSVQQFLAATETRLSGSKKEELPPFVNHSFNYGLHGGLGYSGLTGNMGRYFQNPVNLVFGIELGYRKMMLLLHATQGFSEVKTAFTETRIWPADVRVSVNIFEGSFGYRLLNTAKLNLIPFAGWSLTQFSASDRNEVYRDHHLAEHGFSAGICVDYKLRHRLNFVPGYFGRAETSETRIRTRLTFNPVSYNDLQKGNVISLSTSLSFGGRKLKVQ